MYLIALKVCISALVAGVIAWGGAFMTAVSGTAPMSRTQTMLAIVTGIVAMAKDIQAYLTKQPSL